MVRCFRHRGRTWWYETPVFAAKITSNHGRRIHVSRYVCETKPNYSTKFAKVRVLDQVRLRSKLRDADYIRDEAENRERTKLPNTRRLRVLQAQR